MDGSRTPDRIGPRPRRRWVLATGAVLAGVLITSNTFGAAGDLDTTFSGDGKVITRPSGDGDRAIDVEVQPNGRILVVGWSNDTASAVRYKANGTLDNDFGQGGEVELPAPNQDYSWFEQLILDDQGRPVLVGGVYVPTTTTDDDWGIVRLETDGDPDDSFGGDGFVQLDFNDSWDYSYDVAQAPGNKLVVGGEANNTIAFTYEVAVARFEEDGDPDDTFGGGEGKEIYTFGDRIPDGYVSSILVRDNGKILLGIRIGGQGADFAVAQLNEDGTVDEDFASDGLRLIDFKGYGDTLRAIAWQGNRIVMGGTARNAQGNTVWGLARINSNGSLDQTFGQNGRVMTDGLSDSSDDIYDLAVQGNDKIVAVGTYSYGGNMIVGRYKAGGGLDSTFSGDGIKQVSFPMGASARGVDLHDDRIVVAGQMNQGTEETAFVTAVLRQR